MNLVWTEERPNQEGWFWVLDKGSVAVIKVERRAEFGEMLCVQELRALGSGKAGNCAPFVTVIGWCLLDVAFANALWSSAPVPQPSEP